MQMGLFGRNDDEVPEEQKLADQGVTARTANAVVRKLMDYGFDGLGPFDSVDQVVAEHLKEYPEPEKAIDKLCRQHFRMAATGGFVTGFGGLFTLPVALPANIIEFYVLATRMVGSIAKIRGYDIREPQVRTAVLLALVGAESSDLLAKAGVTGGGKLAQIAIGKLPEAAMMVINKGIGFRVATTMGGRALSRFTRGVPVAGGVIGAGLDTYLMNRIADHAREEFPARPRLAPVPAAD
jgi:hypothetical protein